MALGGGSGMRGGGRGLLITLALSAVLLLVLVSDVGARQDSHTVGAGEFYLRGNANVATQEGTVDVSEQGPVERQLTESEMQYMLEGRELGDYGSNPACANPKHDPSIRCP